MEVFLREDMMKRHMRSSKSMTVHQNMNIGLSVLRLATHISRDSAGPCTLEE
jgi:hypothetical protein